MSRWLCVALLIANAGCLAQLSPAARRIAVAQKREIETCSFLGVVYGGHNGTTIGSSSRHDALEAAGRLNASHIVVLFEQGTKFTADAFDCGRPNAATLAKQAQERRAKAAANAPIVFEKSEPKKIVNDKVIAVMEVEDRTDPTSEMSPVLIRNLGDQIRIFVAEKGMRTIDRSLQENTRKEQIANLKKESYESCYDNSCQIELGKALAASHILRSQLTRFGASCVLNAELIDLRAEVTIGAASSRGACEAEGLLEMSEKIARNLSGPMEQ